MDRKELMTLFNKQPRIGTLSTTNRAGDVDVAVFGSPQMIDEETVVMGIGNNRSLRNLKENPRAVFIVLEPGRTLMDWRGARVYLKVDTVDAEGGLFQQVRSNLEKAAGKQAAAMVQAAIRFKITEVRPIVDMGKQG